MSLRSRSTLPICVHLSHTPSSSWFLLRLLPRLVSGRARSDRQRRLLITGKHLDLSAFVVVAWCAYRHVNTLKFSVVIRTIVAEATIYFLAMVALQVYVQLGFILAV